MRRGAFTLIEMVMAIIVVAISLMTIPLFLTQSVKNSDFVTMQEALLASRTKMENILSYEWDKNSSRGTGVYRYIRVVDVKNGDNELDRNATTKDQNRRVGHIPEDSRRRFHDGNVTDKTYPDVAVNNSDPQSITDFHGAEVTLSSTASFDYVTDLNLTSFVYYIKDDANYSKKVIDFSFDESSRMDVTNQSKSTNIKMIELNTSVNRNNNFTLRAFSSNIGQSELLERSF
jgi:prepilin-type N-terminal cleavage/methylation domain-containing protein